MLILGYHFRTYRHPHYTGCDHTPRKIYKSSENMTFIQIKADEFYEVNTQEKTANSKVGGREFYGLQITLLDRLVAPL
jgi:hypothetical protein